jgi:hypothetical protein
VRAIGVGVHEAVDDPQADRQRDQPLLRTVVEVALEPPALPVARRDDAGPRRRELLARLGVREGHRDELGERGDPVLIPRREGVDVHGRDDHRAPQLSAQHDRRADA